MIAKKNCFPLELSDHHMPTIAVAEVGVPFIDFTGILLVWQG